MYIAELIGDKADVIDAAMRHPGLAPKRNPTIELAMKAVAGEVEMRVMSNVTNDMLARLQDMYDTYEIMNGSYDAIDVESRGDYEAGLDDEVEKVCEPFHNTLSADWLGRNTIDTRLWEDGAIAKLAQSLGKEVYKQLSHGKTPAQVLSNAGIVQSDVEIFFLAHINRKEPMTTPTNGETTLETVAAKLRAFLGGEFDIMTVYDDIEQVVGDDEILSGGAAARLNLEQPDVDALQMAALEHGEDLPNVVVDLIKNANAPAPAKPKREAKPKADKPAKTEAPATAAPVAGALDGRVLALVKAHSGVGDTEMSEKIGVSRATYNNYINGKNAFVPSNEQAAVIRERIVADINGLLEALALIDGTEQMAVS